MYEAFPLDWPVGYQRTAPVKRVGSQFKCTIATAIQFLEAEIQRLGGIKLIISSNVPVNKNGDIRSDWTRYKIDDPGVAIYFNYEGIQVAMCCDQYNRVHENLQALAKSIEAIRGLKRWGVSDFIKRTFSGFAALPESTSAENDIWSILGIYSKPAAVDIVHSAYKNKAKDVHPDKPDGDTASFLKLQDAYNKALTFYK